MRSSSTSPGPTQPGAGGTLSPRPPAASTGPWPRRPPVPSDNPVDPDRRSLMPRPAATEYAPYYAKYLALVPEDDVLTALEAQLADTLAVLRAAPESQGGVR